MKKEVNIIKNKVLINTFKKSKFRNYLNKSNFKKKSFFFLKFKRCLSNIFVFKNSMCYIGINTKQQQIKQKTLKTGFEKIVLLFIKIIFIKINKQLMNSLRFKKNIYLIKFFKINKLFKFFTKNNAGRNNQGTITVFSKGVKKKTPSIIKNMCKWDNKLTITTAFFRNKRKLYSLQKHTTGSFSTIPLISGLKIRQYVFSTVLPKIYWINDLPGNYVFIRFLTKYSIISNINIGDKYKYALSNGTFCQIMEFFLDFNMVKIILPSKKTKIIQAFSFAFLGKNALQKHKFCVLSKAGSMYLKGFKSKVRGVARNPVDHPHGGRTKTNQPEVSIWGWVAKKNK